MSVNIRDIKFPLYNGLESQYEHNVYKYLEETIGKIGYTIKVKKTEYNNVDKALVRGKPLSCDGYIFNNTDKRAMENNLYALIELESNSPKSNLENGIKQLQEYCSILSTRYSQKKYTTANTVIKLIAYDGQLVCVWEYDIENEKIIQSLIGNVDEFEGVQMDDGVKIKFLDMFPQIEGNKEETSEEKTVNNIKTHLRANRVLQSNKAFLMTILAAIYGKTNTTNFEDAIEKLKNNDSDNESLGILKEWKALAIKIEYDNTRVNTKTVINEKLYNDAKELWLLSQNKNMDLYGFIYEELAEEKSKQDEGEYYTSRHIISPIISSVLQKYAFPRWGIKKGITKKELINILDSKNIVDPFCGSGGFLYEFLRYLKIYYQCSDSDINKIAKSALYGFDKNDVMAAFLNMYLIGDGLTNLVAVTSSINWQNMWNYSLENENAVPIQDDIKLEKNIVSNISTFKSFLNSVIDWSQIKVKFNINLDIETFDEFCNYIREDNKISEEQLYYGIKEYSRDHNCVLKYFYNLFKEYSINKSDCPNFDDFLLELGNTDLLITNIPYGPIDDVRLSLKEKGTLESLALKECIDLLKPATYTTSTYIEELERFEEDENGEYRSNNDGGIASIIVPNGIFESENNKELRDYLFKMCNVLGVIKLPTFTFAPYATIQTFILTIQKKAPFEFNSSDQNKKCFFYIVDNDGKSNSKTRFPTELIGKNPFQIKNQKTVIHEYIHDDFAINIEKYPEGYMSKIERAWIHGGQILERNEDWNQKRYSEKFNGHTWEQINDTAKKWTFTHLKEKVFEKRVEKKDKGSMNLILECNNTIDDFDLLPIDEQKELAIKRGKENLLKNINDIKIIQDKNLNIKVELNSNSQIIKNIIKDNYTSVITTSTKEGNKTIYEVDLEKVKELFINTDIAFFPQNIKKVKSFLDDIDEIEILANKVAFFSIESYKQYTLVPENYLSKKDDFMSIEEFVTNIKRLRSLYMED